MSGTVKAIQPVSVDGIEFDALMEQTPTYEAIIPDFPTDDGFSVSDSIINRPLTLELTVYLSNNPITWATRFGESVDRVRIVCDRLLELYAKKKPVTVITNDRVYENMGLENLKLPRKYETGSDLEIPLVFKQTIITQTQTVITPAYLRSGSSKQNSGTVKTKKSTDPKKQDSTLAYKLIHEGAIQKLIGGNP
jgi:hypothetical protein